MRSHIRWIVRARAKGQTRYYSKVCPKHPQFNGERRISNGRCVECQRETLRRLYKTPEYRVKGRLRWKTEKYRAQRRARQRAPDQRAKHNVRRQSPEHRAVYNAWKRERLQNNVQVRLASRLRGRLREALRRAGAVKSVRMIKLVGCSIPFFMYYLEQQFAPGMMWSNYGFYGWHIDHIRPVASFDLTKPAQQRACFHYSNLQPLWGKDNISKGARYGKSNSVSYGHPQDAWQPKQKENTARTKIPRGRHDPGASALSRARPGT